MSDRIIINLSETDTQEFESGNLIQADAQISFEKLIENFKDSIEKSKKNTNKGIDRVHNTILVNGKRGMGKTSFMLSMKNNPEIMKELCPLDIIDPTLIETKEHVFLNIITLIKEKIEEHIKCEKCDDKSTKYKTWKESLKKLAGGFSMLDGVGSEHLKSDMWDSPELILEKGLSNAKQGSHLEKNFHNFIDESLKILEKKAFFLILDDIDTSLDKGSAILETLRKYLTSRKLIIAMLGDIDLYSILVRQLQWEKMDPKNILKDYEFNDNKKVYVSQIEHLEEQYLTKVLKPENRIDLKNLFELKDEWLIVKEHSNLLEEKKNSKLNEESQKKLDNFEKNKKKRLQVEFKSIKEPQELEKSVIDMIKDIYFTSNSNYTKYYERTLLTQSTRSVLQILQVWANNKKLNEEVIFRIKHTFYTTLKKKLESYNLLEIPQEEQFLNLLSMYILKEDISRDNHLKLIPEFIEEDKNIVMFYLNAMSNYKLEPKNYLSYFIKVGYSLEQFLNIETKVENETEKFIDHIGLDSGESSSKIAKRLLSTSYIHTNTHQSPIFFGSVFINQANLRTINKKENVSLILSRVNGSAFGQYNFLSFFNLLGFMADITSDSEKLDDIVLKSEQILEFVLYKDRNIGGEIDSDESEYSIDEALLTELKEWVANQIDIQKLPLFVLAKIWVRTSYTFSNISKNKFENYYQILEMFVVGFLNAIYVEVNIYESLDTDNDLMKNTKFMKNPEKDPEFFYTKIKNYKKTENKVTLYDYIVACPLFKREDNKLIYFMNLERVTLKIDFSSLSEDEKINAVQQIENWKNKADGTIITSLSKQYKNIVAKNLKTLILKINPKVIKSKSVPLEENEGISN